MNDLTSEKSIIAAARRDIAYFGLLYKKYVKQVFRYCYLRLGMKQHIAEDIVSETFVRAIEKFNTYSYQNKPFVVWLYSIAHNLIVDYYRSKKENNISLDSLVPPSDKEEEILDTLAKGDLQERIIAEIPNLPADVQHLFTLRLSEGLTFAQIAKLLGKEVGAVKMQYYRGIKLLRAMVAKASSAVTLTDKSS